MNYFRSRGTKQLWTSYWGEWRSFYQLKILRATTSLVLATCIVLCCLLNHPHGLNKLLHFVLCSCKHYFLPLYKREGVLGCRKFWLQSCCWGLYWLKNGQLGSLGTVPIEISGKWVVKVTPVCELGMI